MKLLHRMQIGPAPPSSSSLDPDSCAWVLDCALSPSHLACSLTCGSVKFLAPSTLQCAFTVPISSPRGAGAAFPERISALQWLPSSPATLLAACGSSDVMMDEGAGRPPRSASAHVVDSRTGRVEQFLPLSSLAGEVGALGAAAISAGGALAVGLGAEVVLLDLRRADGSGGGGGGGGASPALLERYSDSHSEDVTGLQWHPALPAALLSSGEDGLVCAFDTRVGGEMDAITSVLSVGSAVRHVGVFGAHGAHAHVATADGGFSLWNLGSAERVGDFPGLRAQAGAGGVAGWDFLVAARWDARADAVALLAGGVGGELHLARVGRGEAALVASAGSAGHSACVRGAAWEEGGDRLFTGGEDGRVCVWGEGAPGGGAGGAARGGVKATRDARDGRHASGGGAPFM